MREEHESALEELKSAQEELLSSNEEFQSTNEELETSKEELQAANEELTTMNEELRQRNSELRRLNLEIAEARESSNAIVETLREPLLVLNEELRVVRVNDAFLDTFRTRRDETVGRLIYDLGDGQWNLPELRRLLEEIFPQSMAVEDFEVRHEFPGIGARTMLVNARRLKWEGHSLILLAIEDSTARQAVLDELDQASQRKDEFLAMLAHELRNPLAAIRNALEIWRRPDADSVAQARAASIMDRQLRKEVRLIDDLLDVSRIRRGTISLQSASLDLKQTVLEALEELRHELDARQHELSLSLPPGRVPVEGDSVRLEQVVANLLGNSIKFTEPGGHIDLVLEIEGDAAVLRVRDDGIGIPAEQTSAVFDLFFQADRSLDRDQGGLGLGLTLARRLVELHGGTLDARSPGPQQGSEFVLRLPVSSGLPAAAAVEEAKALKGAPRRILVVDDNADAADSITMLLQLDRHELRTVSDGPAGLAALRDFRPDVVLLDIGLPGMDGYEVARRMRALPEGSGALLVAVTGYGREEDRRRAQEAGFDHHLLKPIDRAALAEILSS
jgi:two-component system CheB/CheR fusion protein